MSAAAAMILIGCGDVRHDLEGLAGADVGRSGSRIFETVTWDTIFVVGGDPGDAFLQNPLLLAASDGRLHAYDHYDHRVKTFSSDGQLLWTFGGDGRGPEELVNPVDMKVDSEGLIWLADAGAGRITVLTPDGRPQEILAYPNLLLQALIPLSDRVIALAVSPDRFSMVLDREGEPVDTSSAFPVEGLSEINPYLRQTSSALSPDRNVWGAIFPLGNLFLVFEGTRLRCEGQLIEGEGFPEQAPDSPIWASAVTMGDTSIFILARGRSEDALRIIDEYSSSDCSYRRTMRIPHRMRAMTYSEGVLYFAYNDPAPTLLALRPRFR